MSTTIQTLCAKTIERLGVTPGDATLARILSFARSLDEQAVDLNVLDQIELENAAVEYTAAWTAAEHLESAVGETGVISLRYSRDFLETSCRANPALTQAATARSRMRQILKAIKALLKGAQREAEAPLPASAPTTAGEADSSPETSAIETPVEPLSVAAESDGEGEAPAEQRPNTRSAGASVQPEDADDPTAPPMSRTQRRAQARMHAKRARKAHKRRNHAEATAVDARTG